MNVSTGISIWTWRNINKRAGEMGGEAVPHASAAPPLKVDKQ